MREQAVVFGADRSLVGIVTEATASAAPNPLPAFILLNAGLLHRVGPNRLHVKLARALAATGFTTLRFDFSGVGDSPPRMDGNSLEEGVVSETREAMDFLERTFGVNRVVLLGLCSGADTAFRTAGRDRRVVGVVGINGTYLQESERGSVPDNVSAAIQGRYYRRQLLNPCKWWRCLTGRSDLGQLVRVLRSRARTRIVRPVRRPSPRTSLVERCHELTGRGVHLLLIYSEGSTSFDVLRAVHGKTPEGLHHPPGIHVHQFKNVDHVFTLLGAQQAILDVVEQWAGGGRRCWMSEPTTSARTEVSLER